MYKRIGLFLLFVLTLFTLPTTFADSDCDFTYSNYARAVQLHDMKDYSRALQHYACALEHDPDSQILPQLIEDVYQAMGDLESAQTYYWISDPFGTTFVSTMSCDPTRSDYFETGMERYEQGDLGTALAHFECALLDMPSDPTLLTMMSNIHGNMGDMRSAHYYINQIETDTSVATLINKNALPQLDDDFASGSLTLSVSEVEPTSPTADTLRQSAETFFGAMEFELAIQQYTALLAFEPNNASAHFSIGYAYYSLENPAHALAYLQQALDLQPDYLYAQYLLAMSYSMLDMPNEARNIMSTIYGTGDYDEAYPLALGHVFRNLGYIEAAGIEFYTWLQQQESVRLLVKTPINDIPTTLVMDEGIVYGAPFQAIAGNVVQISVESYFLNPDPIDPLIVVLNSSGIPIAGDDDSGELFDSALNFIPPSTGNYTLLVTHAGGQSQGDLLLTMTGTAWTANTYRGRAHYVFNQNLYRVSVVLISKAVALDGGNANDYMMRAYAYRQIGDMRSAISDYYQALETAPYPEEVYANLGQTYGIMGDLESAIVAYLEALDINPLLHRARCELGMMYVSQGDYASAVQQFDIVLGQNSADFCASENRRATLRIMRELP